jgi:hypothetical protein
MMQAIISWGEMSFNEKFSLSSRGIEKLVSV